MTTPFRGAILTLMIVAGILPKIAAADPVQWSGNGHWYEAVNAGAEGISWTAARDAANARGGYLVTITSSAENALAASLASDPSSWYQEPHYGNGHGPWIGAYQTDRLDEPAGHWAWVNGESWGYTNWADGEPNNMEGTEDYAHFFGYRTATGNLWNDSPDNGQPSDGFSGMRGYIVEYNTYPVPEPASLAVLGAGAAMLLMRRVTEQNQ